MKILRSHKELDVYQLAFKVSMEIFHISKKFPKDEIFSLTSQIRRSSRSVSANIAEAFRKRRYEKPLLQNFLIQKQNQPNLKFGLITVLNVNILLNQFIRNFLMNMKILLGNL